MSIGFKNLEKSKKEKKKIDKFLNKLRIN